ncbi:stAR-related lipid transfer protein 5-like [Glandiceps talaboti]
MANYQAILDDYLSNLLVLESDKDWKLMKESNGIKLFSKPSPIFDGIVYRAEYTFNASPEKIFEMTADLSLIQKTNKHIAEMQIIELIDDNTKVFRTLTVSMMMGLISPREFVSVFQAKTLTDREGYCVYHGAVEHPHCPVVNDYVRAITYPTCRFIFPVEGDPNKARCVGFNQSDIKLFPQTLVEQLTPSTMISHIKSIMKLVDEGSI